MNILNTIIPLINTAHSKQVLDVNTHVTIFGKRLQFTWSKCGRCYENFCTALPKHITYFKHKCTTALHMTLLQVQTCRHTINKLALLYNLRVYTCKQIFVLVGGMSRRRFSRIQEGIWVYSRVFVQLSFVSWPIKQSPFNLFVRYLIISPTFDTVLSKLMNSIDQRKGGKVMIANGCYMQISIILDFSHLTLLLVVFFHFPMWCPGSGVVLDFIGSWYLPSSLLFYTEKVSLVTEMNGFISLSHWLQHSWKSATIRETNHGSGVCKEYYAYYEPKSSILLARTGVWKISSVAYGFSSINIDYSDFPKK